MKTSTKLLTILLAFSFFAMIGSTFTLKAKFDKIDKNDPYSGYKHDVLKPFKYVKLTGNQVRMIQIQPGKSFELIQMDVQNYLDQPEIIWKMNGDTLIVALKNDGNKAPFYTGSFNMGPRAYITAPTLSGVSSFGITSKIKGWKNGTFSIKQTGYGILLTENNFDSLSISADDGSYVKIDQKNKLGNTRIQMTDSSNLEIDKDIFRSFQMSIDSSTHVSLPGGLIKKL